MVYQISNTEYATFSFVGDSVGITKSSLPIRIQRRTVNATITSSLWGAIMQADLPYALADEFEDIFQWSLDFFGIQEGDSFSIIFDEKFVDTTSVGIGRIYGARFNTGGKTIYAVPFANENGKIAYWDYDGTSLKKQMLKAPLKYTRISSKFTYKRLHPVHRIYRPHTGVDYAAPAGTPVHAVADGVITKAGWGGGGGNTIKIKHAGGLETGYLHLKGFAKGIKVGARVSQGQTIGYVGSTGTSTGPHLDYRLWQHGKPVDPLKVTQQPSEPIGKKLMPEFELVRERMISEMDGTSAPQDHITDDDIFRRPKQTTAEGETSEAQTTEKQ
jgi:murein DD-endopeptidase MepM/ murein hydrolase activator NlpD